jgi:hypothetical protein
MHPPNPAPAVREYRAAHASSSHLEFSCVLYSPCTKPRPDFPNHNRHSSATLVEVSAKISTRVVLSRPKDGEGPQLSLQARPRHERSSLLLSALCSENQFVFMRRREKPNQKRNKTPPQPTQTEQPTHSWQRVKSQKPPTPTKQTPSPLSPKTGGVYPHLLPKHSQNGSV